MLSKAFPPLLAPAQIHATLQAAGDQPPAMDLMPWKLHHLD